MSDTLPRWRCAAFRAISAAGFAALSERPADFGPAPELKWIAVADLVIDTSYQRDISRQGVTNVRAIAANFSWAKFGALIVAPVDGKFAVIDGQHRVTAAALLGIRDVPAQVLAIARQEQAAAFNAINSVVTRVHTLQSHAAAVAAGEPDAVEIHDVAAAGGVAICRYPKERAKMAPGETVAVVALKRALKRFGRPLLVAALKCLTRSAHNRPGSVNQASVRVMTLALNDSPDLMLAGPRLFAAMDSIAPRDFADWIDSADGPAAAHSVAREVAEALCDALECTAGRRARR